MKSTIEPLEGNKVKLAIEVDEAEFDRDIDQAFRKIAREVRLPGFRNGKAPRRVLEARIGLAPAREQALRDSIPVYLAKAVREHDVDLIDTPAVEITAGAEDGPVAFDATCAVRPEVTVPGYGGLRIELPSPEASDTEVDDAVASELRRHGSLRDIERPAARGDYVTLDLNGTRDGEPVVGLSTEDWSYEIGQGWVADDFDDELVGATAGDELSFTTTPKGTDEPADFEVSVKSVQEMVLPELSDEWVADNFGDYETLDEWRAALRQRIADAKLGQARGMVLDRTTEALAGLVDAEAPEPMVNADLQARVQSTVQQFQARGITVEQWLAATGQDSQSFVDSLKEQSVKAVKVDLALRAVAQAEGIDVGDDELDAEYSRVAMQVGQKVNQVKKAYERNDAVVELTAQLRKSKALDWLLHHVEIVDTEGHQIDRDLLIGHTHDDDHDHDDGHDHDHDHEDSQPPTAAAAKPAEGSASDEAEAARGESEADAEPAIKGDRAPS